jgi:hypothetical protein
MSRLKEKAKNEIAKKYHVAAIRPLYPQKQTAERGVDVRFVPKADRQQFDRVGTDERKLMFQPNVKA